MSDPAGTLRAAAEHLEGWADRHSDHGSCQLAVECSAVAALLSAVADWVEATVPDWAAEQFGSHSIVAAALAVARAVEGGEKP